MSFNGIQGNRKWHSCESKYWNEVGKNCIIRSQEVNKTFQSITMKLFSNLKVNEFCNICDYWEEILYVCIIKNMLNPLLIIFLKITLVNLVQDYSHIWWTWYLLNQWEPWICVGLVECRLALNYSTMSKLMLDGQICRKSTWALFLENQGKFPGNMSISYDTNTSLFVATSFR